MKYILPWQIERDCSSIPLPNNNAIWFDMNDFKTFSYRDQNTYGDNGDDGSRDGMFA